MARGDYIRPATLVEQVRTAAPFLPLPPAAPGPPLVEALGFLEILSLAEPFDADESIGEPQWTEEYFAVCIAAHHASVATFVPTDVDSKIRGLLWRDVQRYPHSRERMFRLALRAMHWSIEGISKRATALAGLGPVSGHDGERLSGLAGALGSFLKGGEHEWAEEAAAAIDRELAREAAEFRYAYATPGAELDVLRLSATLTHNAGDLDQGISFWPKSEAFAGARARFGRLAHENTKPYGGTFQTAAQIYKRAMSAEGHRHYPLRAVRALRRSPDFLLPLGPFFDEWGATIAVHPGLSLDERAETFAALVTGCRKIAGQRGYFRALAGFAGAFPGPLEQVIRLLPTSARNDWKDAALRKQVAVPRSSFESMMRKMVR
ncbi:MAG: hypothetical protein SFV54_17245 [Bryobacteraceae bacterium]|nr:hypothetical protein [Bryobacteraceae bacterium]